MHVVGITGGVGCGKSTVLSYIQKKYKAYVIQTDLVARSLQEKGQQVFLDIVAAFGETILDEKGNLDRGALAKIVFQDEMELKLLNSIVHPAVKRHVQLDMTSAKEAGCTYFFIESALLFEDNYDAICDEMWYIYADDEIRSSRLRNSRGYSREAIASVIANQKSREEFMERCQVMIDNSGSVEETVAQIDLQMKRIKASKVE